MAILKCKMCGGDLAVQPGENIAVCEYCGSRQTLPKMDDDVRINAFNRANYLRQQGEFDRAILAYERILNEDNQDAEAHFGVVLSRYGIEYVEDPATHERIPTCHRVQLESILSDADYLAALENAPDSNTRSLYEKEAQRIAQIQRDILAISAKEEPYDVFICYKETSESGARTKDSAIAQDIYYELTEEGFKVFFSRITLEGKLGQQYEPYIFAALHSAKVMLVVGTSAENFNAVWVKNEWSRYLTLMKQDKNRLLIPCYRDMDPYDLPDELSMLQSQDMSKIGFLQDLIHGIQKVLEGEKEQPQGSQNATPAAAVPGADSLLERGKLFLEDGDWQSADEYFDRVLDINPKCAEAYLGKLMAKRNVQKEEQLVQTGQYLTEDPDYQKALRFASTQEKQRWEDYQRAIVYAKAMDLKSREKEYAYGFGVANSDYTQAAELFQSIAGFRDAEEQAQECFYIYGEKVKSIANSEKRYQEAAEAFRKATGYRDADAQAQECDTRAEQARIEAERQAEEQRQREEQLRIQREKQAEEERIAEEKRKKRIKKLALIIGPIALALIVFLIILTSVIIPNGQYGEAKELLEQGKYDQAIAMFTQLNGYGDSGEQILAAQYQKAVALKEAGSYEEAIAIFTQLGNYSDSADQLAAAQNAMREEKYNQAVSLMEDGNYDEAISLFTWLGGYRDSADKVLETKYQKAAALVDAGSYEEAIEIFAELGDYSDSADRVLQIKYQKAAALMEQGNFDEALEAYIACGAYQKNDEILAIWQSKNAQTVCTGTVHAVGLKSDGTVVATGYNDYGQCDVEGWADIVAISAGNTDTVGLKSDGTVVAVGDNRHGQCDVEDWTDIVAIAAGDSHTVGLKSNGTVVATGLNNHGQCNVEDWTDIVAIAAGGTHTIGLKLDGTVVATNYLDQTDSIGNFRYYRGQCEVYGWTDIVAVAAGDSYTVGLKSNGTAVATVYLDSSWYYNGQCEVDGWTDIVAVAAGDRHTAGLKSNGTVVATGSNNSGQCNVEGWTDIVSVAVNSSYTLGLKSDGTVVAAGDNEYGQCDVSDWSDIKMPFQP